MAVVADEQICASLRQIDLHANETISVTWQVVKRDALTEVHGPLVERLPIQIQLEVVLQVHTHIRARCYGPESRTQLKIVNPDLHVFPVEEHIEPSGMIKMQMPDYDLLDVLDLVTRGFDRRVELVLRLISDAREDIGDLRSAKKRNDMSVPVHSFTENPY